MQILLPKRKEKKRKKQKEIKHAGHCLSELKMAVQTDRVFTHHRLILQRL
jgi:hypothetical protein